MNFNDAPLVQVIINCLNCEKVLCPALMSLNKQTYQNWELIFVDNGSRDNSATFVKKSIGKKARIVTLQKTVSLGQARNVALKYIKGPLVAFLDSDDVWHPFKLEFQVHQFLLNETLALLYSNGSSNLKQRPLTFEKLKFQKKETVDILSDYDIPISTAMIKTSIIVEKKIEFREEFQVLEDKMFFFEISFHGLVLKANQPFAQWTIRPNSETDKNFHLFPVENIRMLELVQNDGKFVHTQISDRIVVKLKNKIALQQAVVCWRNGEGRRARQYLGPLPRALKRNLILVCTFLPSKIAKPVQRCYLYIRPLLGHFFDR